jgi:DNA-binding Xre family transcriptional regulator
MFMEFLGVIWKRFLIFVPNINLTTMTANKDLNRLKVVLAEKKKSNLWLSKQLGCAPTTVSKWCTNSSQPPLETLLKITKLLNVDIKDLIRFEEMDKEN